MHVLTKTNLDQFTLWAEVSPSLAWLLALTKSSASPSWFVLDVPGRIKKTKKTTYKQRKRLRQRLKAMQERILLLAG